MSNNNYPDQPAAPPGPSRPNFAASSPWPTPGNQWQPPTHQQPQQTFAQPQPPAQTQPPKRRSRLAGILAVALLAGGVGGAGGVAATSMLLHQERPSATSSISSHSSGNTTSQTVVQADPSNPDWRAVADAASEAVVAIQVAGQDGSGSQGSGVVIDAEGNIVTNNHVVAGGAGTKLTVLLGNTAYSAEVVGTDPATDLAVIRLVDPPDELSVISFGDNTALKVGDPVMAIGNPLGLSDTATTGIVSALNRPVTTRAVSGENADTQSDSLVVTAAIQTNAAINPGNSGGALLNNAGELVGITSSIATIPSANSESRAGNIGIGFAIGADQVRYVVDQLISDGTAEHPQLGISATDITQTGPMGAEVSTVADGSPAQKAGIQQGDLITAVNDIPVSSVEQLVAVVRAGQVGKEMVLTLIRNGSEESVKVTPVAAAR